MNDPKPFYWKGKYHLFYQYNPTYEDACLGKIPWGNAKMCWGHASSSDLVHWVHHPLALSPDTAGPDKDGCWTGCVVSNKETNYIFYTGVRPEVQCLASSKDIVHWEKYTGNPVIAAPPKGLEVTGFRDPCVWQEHGLWYMLLGSGIKETGGAVLLYKSPDMVHWEYMYPFYLVDNDSWRVCECPDFFPLSDKHILLISMQFSSTRDNTYYFIGEYTDNKFIYQEKGKVDFGGYLYAAKTLVDAQGRRLLWGWIPEASGRPEYRWAGVQSLPRELYIDSNNQLGFRPVPEIKQLRRKHWHYDEMLITADTQRQLENIRGDCLEILAEVMPGRAEKFCIYVCCAPDGSEKTSIVCNFKEGNVSIDTTHSSLKYGKIDKEGEPGNCRVKYEESLRIHIFLDRSVLEVFVDEKICLTNRIYPSRPDSLGVSLSTCGGNVRVKSFDVWQLKP